MRSSYPGDVDEPEPRGGDAFAAFEPGADTREDVGNAVMSRLFGRSPHERSFGRYRVLRRLGKGGMGTVYLAQDPSLDREVAIKVLHVEIAEESRAALVAEAKAMARLSHPNVVGVYDVGEEEGRIFIAMERIEGIALSEWSKRRSGSWRDLVALYRDAARGLAAAHEAGLVHQDFKPDNVLVGEDARARVADFGLAQLGEAKTIDETLAGRSGSDGEGDPSELRPTLAGTPAYMAPERLEGAPGNPLSDQFSFFVALYEGLCGERPFRGSNLRQLLHKIAEDQREPRPDTLRLPTRLWAIIERGLSHEPTERHPSMDAVAIALERCLVPWLRRLLLPAMGIAVLGSALGGAYGYMQLQASRCDEEAAQVDGVWNDQAREAVRSALTSTARPYAVKTWERVDADLDEWGDRWRSGRHEACSTRGEDSWAVRRDDCYLGHLAEFVGAVEVLSISDPGVLDSAQDIASSLPDLARCSDERWLRARVFLPPDPAAVEPIRKARELLGRAAALNRVGRYEEGLPLAREQLEVARSIDYGPLEAEAQLHVGELQKSLADNESAERSFRAAFVLATELDAPSLAIRASLSLGGLMGLTLDRHAEGLTWLDFSEGPISRLGEGADRLAIRHADARARIRLMQGHPAEAQALLDPARERATAILDPDDPLHIALLTVDAAIHDELGDSSRGLELLQTVIERTEKRLGSSHPSLMGPRANLVRSLAKSGRLDEAEVVGRRQADAVEAVRGPDHPFVANALTNLANLAIMRGHLDEAEAHCERALAIKLATYGPTHSSTSKTLMTLGIIADRQGDPEQALEYYERGEHYYDDPELDQHPGHAATLISIAISQSKLDRDDEARLSIQRAQQIIEATLGAEHAELGPIFYVQADLEAGRGEYERALELISRAEPIFAASVGEQHLKYVQVMALRGEILRSLGRLTEAEPLLEMALARGEELGDFPSNMAISRLSLARLRWTRGQHEGARAQALRAEEDTRDDPGAHVRDELMQWLAEHPAP